MNTDCVLVDRILQNLLVNAVLHGEPGTIDITTDRKEEGVYLNVINDGFIPDTEQIFEIYYTTKEKEGGTGLGLSIIRGNAELLGGKLSVSNEIEGDKKRVRFEVYLPIKN